MDAPVDIVDRHIPVVEVPTDTCDECGARAYVYAAFKTGSLAWCAHHGTEHWDAINATAEVVIDHRWRVLEVG